MDDFSALQQQVMEGRGLVQRIEATLNTCLNTALMEVNTGKVSVQIYIAYKPILYSKVYYTVQCYVFTQEACGF